MSDEIGYIWLYRQMKDWEWYTDVNTFKLFLHLLLSVNRGPKKHRGIQLKAGDILTGRIKLASEAGLSERNVRTALKHLKQTDDVSVKTYSNFSVISITNWKKYQAGDQRVTSKRPAGDQRVTTNNKEDNIDNSKENNKKKKPLAEKPLSVSVEVWEDFLVHRKSKKALLTETAMKGIITQAEKAGWTLEEALSECCIRNWQSFNAAWVEKKEKPNNGIELMDEAMNG